MEIEAKFLIKNEDSFRAIEALDRLSEYPLSVGKLQVIEDTFLDTKDLEITALGYYLRLRKTAGEKGQWITIKSLDGFEGGRHKREEYVSFLPTGVPLLECPETAVRNRIFEMAGKAELRPLIKLKQKRLFRQLELDGRHVAELALDRVDLKSENREKQYLELEVELKKGGTEEDLNLISAFLSKHYRLEPGSYSKFERALLFRDRLWEKAILSPRERAFCTQLETHGNIYGKWARALLEHERGQSTAELSLLLRTPEPEIKALFKKFQKERLSIFPFARNENAAREIHFQPPEGWGKESSGGQARAEPGFIEWSPESLLELYSVDKTRAIRVKDRALALFDGLEACHGYGAGERKLLEIAALLQDIGSSISKEEKYRLGKEIVLAHPLKGLDIRNLRLLALTLELQAPEVSEKTLGKALKESRIRLSPGPQNKALVLAAFIRIAALLESQNMAPGRIGEIRQLEEGMEIELLGPGAEKTAKKIEKRRELWEHLFGTKIWITPLEVKIKENIGLEEESEKERREGKKKEKKKENAAQKPGIKPESSMVQVAYRTFSSKFEEMLVHEKETRKGDDAEELHDMRVAIRKMRAAAGIFEDYLNSSEIKPHLKGLRSTLGALGGVRDLDVFQEKAEKYLENLPPGNKHALDALFEVLDEERKNARKAMLTYLDSEKYARFKKEMAEYLALPEAWALPTTTPKHDALPYRVRDVLPLVVYSRLAEISAYAEWVEGPYVSVERLHRLRIAAKGFRYTFEFFEDVLGKDAKATIREFKALQDHLGDIHDAAVAIDLLNSYLRTGAWGLESRETAGKGVLMGREGVQAYLEYREKELESLLDTFPAAWAKVRSREFRQQIEKALENLYEEPSS